MSENKINLVVPKEYNGKPIEVVLREGEASVALDPKEPERVVINGTIEAPFCLIRAKGDFKNNFRHYRKRSQPSGTFPAFSEYHHRRVSSGQPERRNVQEISFDAEM